MDAYQAGQQLGTLLFGNNGSATGAGATPNLYDAVTGNAAPGGVYYKTLTQGAQAQNAMQEARTNRAKALIQESMLASRQKLPTAVGGVYINPAQAALADAVLGSNSTINLGDLGKLQSPNAVTALGQAATDMTAGNFTGYNQQTALAEGKPYQPVIVKDSTMLPNGVPLGDAAFTAQATPVGNATIGLRGAETLAAQALAGQRDARTNAINNPQPKAGKAPRAAAATRTLLEALMPQAAGDDGKALPLDIPRAMQRYQAAVSAGALTVPDILQWNTAHPPLGVQALVPTDGSTPAAPTGVNFVTPAAAPSLGDAAIGAPAPGTAVRTDSNDALGAAAASALASVDPTHSLPAAQKAQFANDPRVLTLQQQATKAITAGHADPARVAAKLQQEYATMGYSTGAGGG